MAENAVQPSIKTVDPMFAIPDGVTDAVYGTPSPPMYREGADIDEYTGTEIIDSDFDTEDETGADAPVPGGNNGIWLDTPDIIDVASQTLRRSAGGFNVVDVVVDVEDVEGATNYEVRVTKL